MRKLTYSVVVLLLVLSTLPMNVFASEKQEIEVRNSKESIDRENSNKDSEVKEQKPQEDVATQESKEQEDKEQSDQKESKEKSSKVDQAESTEQKTKIQKEQNNPKSEEEKQTISKEKTKESTPKRDKNGIVEGTKVYGIDISEFSEEELQYIPKGWRDGVTLENSEHPHGTDEMGPRARATYPNVNNYIKKNKLKPVRVKTEYKSQFPKFNYRFNRPEGVVAHETANNNSTIRGEINYMTRNYNNAFVHAFVDGRNVIEIHPTRYGAWGAGYYGNQRFIHVELVRVHNFDEFARSINNYAEYIATMLYQYNLGVSSAESSGSGTLWSHKAVSRHLGGTNHVDPHGYFAKYGYNWTEFTKLVKTKYNSISVTQTGNAVKESKTSRLGHIRNQNVNIYSKPTATKGTKAGTAKINKVYYIKKQAKFKNQLFYLISTSPSATKNTLGWVKSQDMSTHVHKGVDKKSKQFVVKGTGKAYTKAWGGEKDKVYDLKNLKGQILKVHLTEKVGNNTWYRGVLKGKTVFIHSSYLTKYDEQKTSHLGHIRNQNVNIYSKPTATKGTKAGATKINKVYYIKKQAKFGNQLYYLIGTSPTASKNTLGWVKSQDMSTHAHKGVDKKNKTFYVKGTGKAYTKAWGGEKDKVYDLKQLKNKPLKVHLTEKVGGNTWYRGVLNGKTVFIHSSYLTKYDEQKTSRLGHIRNGNIMIYSNPAITKGKKAGVNATHKVYYIKKQAKLGNQLYYLISTSPSAAKNTLGWVKSQDMSTHVHKGVDKKSKQFVVKGTGKAYTKAWGGEKDKVYDLKNLKGQILKVHLTERVGNNTWYRGVLNGKTVFIHSSYLK